MTSDPDNEITGHDLSILECSNTDLWVSHKAKHSYVMCATINLLFSLSIFWNRTDIKEK